MNEIRRRVAQAIDEAMIESRNMACGEKQDFIARAAITALRDPTPQMRAAGTAATKGSYDSFTFGAYELMIDEALKG